MSKSLPVAVLLRLAPRQVGGEEFVVGMVLPTVVLAPGLLRAVPRVRVEGLLHADESVQHVLYARRLLVLPHVSHQREEIVSPE